MSREAPMSLSVAIRTCNQEKFIGEATDSARDRDYPAIEIVVADYDDSTSEVFTDYAAAIPMASDFF